MRIMCTLGWYDRVDARRVTTLELNQNRSPRSAYEEPKAATHTRSPLNYHLVSSFLLRFSLKDPKVKLSSLVHIGLGLFV